MLRRWVALPVSSRCCGVPSLSIWAESIRLLLMSASRRPLKGICVAGPCCVDGCIRHRHSKLQKFKIAMSWQTGILPAGPPHHVLRSHSADKGRSDSSATHSLYSSHLVSKELSFVLKIRSSCRVRVTLTPIQRHPRPFHRNSFTPPATRLFGRHSFGLLYTNCSHSLNILLHPTSTAVCLNSASLKTGITSTTNTHHHFRQPLLETQPSIQTCSVLLQAYPHIFPPSQSTTQHHRYAPTHTHHNHPHPGGH